MAHDDLMGTADVSLAQAAIVVDELVNHGLEHACASPGSRSTPIVLALERDARVTLHVHLDERSSAFFALGLAKASRRPVAALSTSGTAAANFFPAVVEATQARASIVLLTADRPPRLRGTGANQTIDQIDLYGRYPRAFVELPLPAEPVPDALVRSLIRSAFREAISTKGPIHLNLPFEEPLTPGSGRRPRLRAPAGRGDPVAPDPPLTDGVQAVDVDRAVGELAADRGVVVAGPMPEPPARVLDLAERLGWPVLAEPLSGLRVPGRALAAGQHLAAADSWLAKMRPELVLQVGAAPTTRATQRLVAMANRLVVVDRFHLEPDPAGDARLRLNADPDALARDIADHLPRGKSAWRGEWLAADSTARDALDSLLDSWDEPFEGRVARDLAAAIPDGGTLFVGNSMPVRDLDAYMTPRAGLRVLANRGASGIDGLVSTALGVSVASAPTFALIGDLSLLHDVGSLLWSARRGFDAVFVVPNNDGGAVFSFLPHRELPELEHLFTTPHGLDLGLLCAAAGVGHTRIAISGELSSALEAATAAGGVHVIEVPSDRERNVTRHAQVQDAVDAALARV